MKWQSWYLVRTVNIIIKSRPFTVILPLDCYLMIRCSGGVGAEGLDITVAFYYLTQYSRNFTGDVNGTRLGGSVSPKIQGSSEFLNRQSSSFALQFKISRTIIFKDLKQLLE